MHFEHVWKEAEGTNRPAPIKEAFCLCCSEFMFMPEQSHLCFHFGNGIFTLKPAKCVCCMYLLNKESLTNAIPNPLAQN